MNKPCKSHTDSQYYTEQCIDDKNLQPFTLVMHYHLCAIAVYLVGHLCDFAGFIYLSELHLRTGQTRKVWLRN